MIDLLLINPGEQARPLIHVLSACQASYQIVTTNGQMFGYQPELKVLDLNSNPWDKSQTFKSALAWNNSGQNWADAISDQVVLHNRPLIDRRAYYLTHKFEVELGKMFNIVSHNCKHVVIDAFVYKDAKWGLIKDQSRPFFVDGVETAFAFLDRVGIANGPSQVFIEPNGKISVRLVPKALISVKVSNRDFLDIWPLVLALDKTQASLAFDDWIEQTGPAKQFQLASGL
jgi:hypothetical protein